MVHISPLPCTMQFTHNKQSWDVTATHQDGNWLVTVMCDGEVVESVERDMDRPASDVAKQYVLDKFGKDYGLVDS